MDLDKEFVKAVCREGKDAYLAALDRGVSIETHLFGDGKVMVAAIVSELKDM